MFNLGEAFSKELPPVGLMQELAAWYVKTYPTVGTSFVRVELEITSAGELLCHGAEIGHRWDKGGV